MNAPAPEPTGCGRAPIHPPAAVQPHGALLALDPVDLRIVHAGGDTAGLLGAPPAALLGQTATAIPAIDRIRVARLRALLSGDRDIARPLHAFTLTAPDATSVDVIAHQASGLLVLEFEPQREAAPDNALALVQLMIRRVRRADTVQALCDAVAAELRAVTGFDRVLICRVLADGSGEVTAEALGDGVDSLRGLRYPASQISQHGRALDRINGLRAIPDARHAAAPIIPALHPRDGTPLDLSHSVIRGVSPAHRDTLAALGVVASMSLPIVQHGQFWGLIACHHGAPRYLPYRLREACDMFAELMSSQLEARIAAEQYEARLRSTRIHEELVTRMSQESDLAEGLIRFHPNLLDFIPAAGVGLWIDGQFTALGVTPSADQVEALIGWLGASANDGVFQSDCLPLIYPPAAAYADRACGLLALSISKTPRDYLLWFRPEAIRSVSWAGQPTKPASPGAERLERHGLAAWQQSVRLHARPWRESEIEAAHRLRLSLLDVVLRRIEQIARERKSARLLQEQLMRQLERGLRQSQDVARTLDQETKRRASVEADLSQVLRRTVEDQEAERLRIARELHDTLGQSLTLLHLGIESIGQATPGSDEMRQRIAGIKSLTVDIGREVNRLAWEIRPTALDDLGIQTAIQHLLDSWSQKAGVRFDLHLTLGERRLPAPIETTLYRVLQEALTNIVRHAEARHVGVILRLAEQQVTMIVEDDGRGFAGPNPDTKLPERLGLLGIRERLSLVGGSLEIESAPGKGTALFARIPL
ncbi:MULTISPECIES: GAF domain-containing protein [Rhodopseudomonas]|uniref:GAF domain-containing protein n=1 Tax=Rhodopseudomonas TaxID=1073 RepID=UPI001F354FEA|nr:MULTISPECIES: GAF domain-containing protein [Rhodopseudomonas]MDF3809912.1 GAF domain-containing protein [Rhodopseudomonas sp. BAL398]WOK17832.1 GAF domain-containing protein [Rhodopseudomonas sp. BAL398]